MSLWLRGRTIHWPTARLKDHVELVNGWPFDSSAFNDTKGTPIIRIRDLLRSRTDTYFDGKVPDEVRVQNGDLLIGMDGDFNSVTWQGGPAVFNQRLCMLHAGPGVDQRFLAYFIDLPLRAINEVTYYTTVKHLSSVDLLDERMPMPSLTRQRDIADFLDAETARIDALIAKKRHMVALLEERRTRVLEELFADAGLTLPASVDPPKLDSMEKPADWRIVRLSQTLRQLTNGYVGPTRDILQLNGVPYIQGLHIKRGRIDFNRRPYYVSREWHAARPRIALRPNDVLIVQTGDIGQVALVPKSIGDASCHALLIARVNEDVVSGPYLAAYLQSHLGYHSLLRMATGALHPHLEFGIKEVRIVVPPIEIQNILVREIERRQALFDRAVDRLGQQIRLLLEHRQALITAAVTGRIEVPGAAASHGSGW